MADAQNNFIPKKVVAEDIMTEEVQVINQETPIVEVAHLMLRMRVSAYPIVNDSGEVVGIVTLTDLFRLLNQIYQELACETAECEEAGRKNFHTKVSQWRDSPVSGIMTPSVVSVDPETPLSEIVKMVAEKNLHTFPVMENGKLVGVIGRHDVLNAAFVYG